MEIYREEMKIKQHITLSDRLKLAEEILNDYEQQEILLSTLKMAWIRNRRVKNLNESDKIKFFQSNIVKKLESVWVPQRYLNLKLKEE